MDLVYASIATLSKKLYKVPLGTTVSNSLMYEFRADSFGISEKECENALFIHTVGIGLSSIKYTSDSSSGFCNNSSNSFSVLHLIRASMRQKVFIDKLSINCELFCVQNHFWIPYFLHQGTNPHCLYWLHT